MDCGEDPFEVRCEPTPAILKQWSDLNITNQQGWVIDRTYTMDVLMKDPDLAKYFHYDFKKPVSRQSILHV